jgi:hypothetical protein
MVLLVAAAELMLLTRHAIRVDSSAGTARALRSIAERTGFSALLLGCKRVTRSSKGRERERGDEKSGFPHHDISPTLLVAHFSAQQFSITES